MPICNLQKLLRFICNWGNTKELDAWYVLCRAFIACYIDIVAGQIAAITVRS